MIKLHKLNRIEINFLLFFLYVCICLYVSICLMWYFYVPIYYLLTENITRCMFVSIFWTTEQISNSKSSEALKRLLFESLWIIHNVHPTIFAFVSICGAIHVLGFFFFIIIKIINNYECSRTFLTWTQFLSH